MAVRASQHGMDVVMEGLERIIMACIWCPTFVAEDCIIVVVCKKIIESLLILNGVIRKIIVDDRVVRGGARIQARGGSSRCRPVGPLSGT